jgi:hypothetical protein
LGTTGKTVELEILDSQNNDPQLTLPYCGLAFSNLKLSFADIAAGFQSKE